MTKLRTCVACRIIRPKEEMLRVVRYEGEYHFDSDGKAMGRGAYVCPECAKKAIKTHAFNRAYKAQLPAVVYETLQKETSGE